eukprot:3118253-Rhodomonas_salina.1
MRPELVCLLRRTVPEFSTGQRVEAYPRLVPAAWDHTRGQCRITCRSMPEISTEQNVAKPTKSAVSDSDSPVPPVRDGNAW